MSDQLLPDFDGPGSEPGAARPGPKKPRRKPAKKKAVRAPSLKVAKRVPKKRRVRKAPIQYGTAAQKAAAGRAYAEEQNPPLMTKEFNATLDIIGMLHTFEPLIRRRIMDRLIKTFP